MFECHRIALALAAATVMPVAAVAAPAAAADAAGGDITIVEPWSRATAPGAANGAGFVTIRNAGDRPDRLVSATSPRAARVEIHSTEMEGGVMRMRVLPAGLEIPAKGEARLASGGAHLMLVGLRTPLAAGERVPVTLRFARAGDMPVEFSVAPLGAARLPGHGSGEGGHGHAHEHPDH